MHWTPEVRRIRKITAEIPGTVYTVKSRRYRTTIIPSALTLLSSEQKRRGVVAATRGNHGAALAWAGRMVGVPIVICVPRDTHGAALSPSMRSIESALLCTATNFRAR